MSPREGEDDIRKLEAPESGPPLLTYLMAAWHCLRRLVRWAAFRHSRFDRKLRSVTRSIWTNDTRPKQLQSLELLKCMLRLRQAVTLSCEALALNSCACIYES